MRQDPEWDESSAFFANAASQIRLKGSSRRSKENKENESKREVSGRALTLSDESVQHSLPTGELNIGLGVCFCVQ